MAPFDPAAKPHSSRRTQETVRDQSPIVAIENRAAGAACDKPTCRKPGTGKGIWMAADFDEPLDDFGDDA